MEINIELSIFSFIADFFSQSPDIILRQLILYFAWIPLSIIFLKGCLQLWIFYRQLKYASKQKFMLLAIDIPRSNVQTPKAVENLLIYLQGAHGTNNLIDTYWDGKFQLAFSLEIISIEGYTQFLVRTPIGQRNLVESAVYSQYPDAEITEVDDYTIPYRHLRFPNDEYDVVGGDFIYSGKDSYPIKTYEEFEHQLGPAETHFKDPMASLMDMCSSLGNGEHFWFQLIIQPEGFDWAKKLEEEVGKILKEKPKFKPNLLNKAADSALAGLNFAAISLVGGGEDAPKKEEKKDDTLKMMNLKPKEKKQVESIYMKTAKTAFNFKMRVIYLAKKEAMNKSKVFGGFVGYVKQFTAIDLNGLKPDMDRTITSTAYFFKDSHLNSKKNKAFKNYVSRDMEAGRKPGIMNVEEIATLWHFPLEGSVKAPLIQKAPGRKAQPPMGLPQSEQIVSQDKKEPLFLEDWEKDDDKNKKAPAVFSDKKLEEAAGSSVRAEDGAPPPNLPFA